MKKFVLFLGFIFVSMIILGNISHDRSVKDSEDENSLTGVLTTHTNQDYLDSLRSAASETSLLYWTADTTWNSNPELVLLLDTLFRYVGNDNMAMSVEDEKQWMDMFRYQLCKSYSELNIGSESISEFAKADSVMNVAKRLYDLSELNTTMSMTTYGSIIYSFNVFRTYNEFSEMVSICADDSLVDLVYKEWELYQGMLKLMKQISTGIVSLNYYGGSITGPIATSNICLLTEARYIMYSEIVKLYKNLSYSDKYGLDLPSVGNFYFEILDKTTKLSDEVGDRENEDQAFVRNQVHEIQENISRLRPLVNDWIKVWDRLDYAITSDGYRHNAERIASVMLIEWASIVTAN